MGRAEAIGAGDNVSGLDFGDQFDEATRRTSCINMEGATQSEEDHGAQEALEALFQGATCREEWMKWAPACFCAAWRPLLMIGAKLDASIRGRKIVTRIRGTEN
ncbi:hypothetical protein WOA01_24195 [Methylocystis sp. IM2]|uniref:hypothetical protein n=1 Tax=Methylocystis sp. IM2 TaxID=3136563 RepID=UPI0030F67898